MKYRDKYVQLSCNLINKEKKITIINECRFKMMDRKKSINVSIIIVGYNDWYIVSRAYNISSTRKDHCTWRTINNYFQSV